MLAHCPPSSKWVPGGNTGEVKGGEERNWPPYLTMLAAQDKCASDRLSPTYEIIHGTHLYLTFKATLYPCLVLEFQCELKFFAVVGFDNICNEF